MRKTLITLSAVLAPLTVSMPASAQQQAPAERSTVNVQRLPLNLQRVHRALTQASSTENHEGLRIRYQVDVYGRAPQLQLFTEADNLANGPVPKSGPTHQDMLYQMTPQEFRSPPADLTSIFRWLADRATKK